MAILIRGKTDCAICEKVIGQEDKIVATTHFITDREDPLWIYSDAVMHADCFSTWPQRIDFVDRYNSTVGKITWGNGTRHSMLEDGSIVSIRSDVETNQDT